MSDDNDSGTTEGIVYDDREDRTELNGRIVNEQGRIVAFVTLSAGDAELALAGDPGETAATLQRVERAIAAEFDEDDLRLIDGHGEEVSGDA